MESNLSKIIITQTFKVITREPAIKIADSFQIEEKYHNCYWVEDSKARHKKPLMIRNGIDYLKRNIPNQVILVLALQEDDQKLISSKPRTPREPKQRNTVEAPAKKEMKINDKPTRSIISVRPSSVSED